jgi:outer membrane lipoprotein-sorting protein
MLNKTSKSQFYAAKIIFLLFLTLSMQQAIASDISGEIKTYIRDIKSIAVEFLQSDSNGSKFKGMLIIDKPHKFRCNYYEPFPLVIVGSSNYVSVYDYEMEHLSRIKAENNIFNFLLVNDIDFENKFKILSAKTIGNKYVLKLKNDDLNKISEVYFDKRTKHIKQMKIYEDNNTITLSFGPIKQIKNVAKTLFIMKDPDIFEKPRRLNKEDLKKRFTKI